MWMVAADGEGSASDEVSMPTPAFAFSALDPFPSPVSVRCWRAAPNFTTKEIYFDLFARPRLVHPPLCCILAERGSGCEARLFLFALLHVLHAILDEISYEFALGSMPSTYDSIVDSGMLQPAQKASEQAFVARQVRHGNFQAKSSSVMSGRILNASGSLAHEPRPGRDAFSLKT